MVCHTSTPRAGRVIPRRIQFLRFPDILPFFLVGAPGGVVQARKSYSSGGLGRQPGERECVKHRPVTVVCPISAPRAGGDVPRPIQFLRFLPLAKHPSNPPPAVAGTQHSIELFRRGILSPGREADMGQTVETYLWYTHSSPPGWRPSPPRNNFIRT